MVSVCPDEIFGRLRFRGVAEVLSLEPGGLLSVTGKKKLVAASFPVSLLPDRSAYVEVI